MHGPGHDTFWEWCALGELRLQRCCGCGELSWPAVSACDNCGSQALEWQRMSGNGKVVSWCTFERDYYEGTFPIPWTNIVVELAEGPYFVCEPGNFEERAIAFGMPVKVAFIACEDSRGAFQLPVFDHA
jgi:uncharacterized OB-fold protein